LTSLRNSHGIREPEQVTDKDSQRVTRSFHIEGATLARFQAAFAGSQALSYGTELAGQLPSSLSAAADEALNLWSTLMEDKLNGGQEFDRVARLSPGPSPAGAQEGARKRRVARENKESASSAR
jgi:hypothetical protein